MDIEGKRSAGILMHISSLPSEYGIGDLGPEAYQFAEDSRDAGAQLWQMLPLVPTGYGNSPYAGRSAFAGNEMLISPDLLFMSGLLSRRELVHPEFPSSHVDFKAVSAWKLPLLYKAAERTLSSRYERKAFEAFCDGESYWLDDYALFMAIHDKHDNESWYTAWTEGERNREPSALSRIRKENEYEIGIHKALQYLFDKQIKALRLFTRSIGIRTIGDIPIYAAADSADTWSHIELFKTDAAGRFSAVSGVPPDIFSPTGQLWGNPVYNWKKHEETGFRWWKERIRRCLAMTDMIRIDHFKGFDEYYEIKAGAETAEHGVWKKAPGKKLFAALKDEFGALPIIAEDLGWMTDGVEKLRTRNGFPGMKIAQGGFSRLGNGFINGYDDFLPHNYTRQFVAYTGTHDNDTTRGWFDKLSADDKHMVREYLSSSDKEIVWSLIKSIMLSNADTAIFPMQDILELGSEARMNFPSTCNDRNWAWRMEKGAFNDYRKGRLLFLSRISGRNGMTKAEFDKSLPTY